MEYAKHCLLTAERAARDAITALKQGDDQAVSLSIMEAEVWLKIAKREAKMVRKAANEKG